MMKKLIIRLLKVAVKILRGNQHHHKPHCGCEDEEASRLEIVIGQPQLK